jgi:septal ring factor EnvC (AmiA/AmiB activator)
MIIASRARFCRKAAASLLITACGLWPAAQAAKSDEQAQKQQELERLRSRIDDVTSGLSKEREKSDAAGARLQEAERAIAEARARLKAIEADLAEQGRKLAQANAERDTAAQALQAQQQALAEQARAAYLMGGRSGLQILLSQDDPSTIGRLDAYYEYFSRARVAQIQAVNQQLAVLKDAETAIETEQTRLDGLRQEQADNVRSLAAARQTRSQEVAQINGRISDSEIELARLQGEERSVQKLLKALQDALAREPAAGATLAPKAGGAKAAASGAGRALPGVGPLTWPLRGALLARYGEAKAGGRLSWNGLWIAAAAEAPVRAAAQGRVAYVGWVQRFGLLMIVEHPGGYFTLYGHNAATARRVGDVVNAGDVIARAGDTGGHEQTGLYFELRKGSEAVDPLPWLPR